MLSPIEIPTMLFWENGNTWYGSKGDARFFTTPLPTRTGRARPTPHWTWSSGRAPSAAP